MDDFPIERVRADTPAVRDVVHFNNAGSALPPTIVVDTVVAYLRREAEIGGYEAAAEAAEPLAATYDSLAALVGGRADQIAIIENATRAWDMAVYGFPFKAGDRVITARSEYGSNLLAFLQLQKRFGIDIVLIEDDADGQIDLDSLDVELERGAAIMSLSHIATSGGLINPATEVGQRCRDHGVFFVLDACQSLGQVPLDVAELHCDVLSTTGRKYLRGPRGTGFLWAGERAMQILEPPLIDQHAAIFTADDAYELLPNAKRFENWERYFAGQVGLGAAADYLLDLGVEPTTSRLRSLGAELRGRLDAIDGVVVRDKGRDRGGIVTFTVDGLAATEVKARLSNDRIHTSVSVASTSRYDLGGRGLDEVVRASAHYYNTSEEVDRFAAALQQLS